MDPDAPKLRSTLSNLLVINVVVFIVLIGGGYVATLIRHRRNQRASDALYREAVDAYSQAEALKDADDSQFIPRYKSALAAPGNRDMFNSFHSVGLQYMESSQRADQNLGYCVVALLVYRYPGDPQTKSRMVQEINHCNIDHTPGRP